ncbi:hypothetical protein SISNIDRAFT_456134 [Sistotremastrum niveocremeum HHB9708]|uniref:F-box domain-containing protein n=1 Tax=Sistotremastrum niveocremeum HHB9708 TaxID=1314777 RepID=A0A164SZW2_9AGAM|nr:hypothetical protein SISNIDRAFT_456134 [Sistotremastrum niveocremeum HHB9708]
MDQSIVIRSGRKLRLPVELLRIIVEIAARKTRKTGLKLGLVCHEFRVWTLHIVYKVVALRSFTILCDFASVQGPATCNTIAHLYLGSNPMFDGGLLKKCANLQDLAVKGRDTFFGTSASSADAPYSSSPYWSGDSSSRPKHITVINATNELHEDSGPMPALVKGCTHLTLSFTYVWNTDRIPYWGISKIPGLTHLTLIFPSMAFGRGTTVQDIVRRICAENPRIEVIAVAVRTESRMYGNPYPVQRDDLKPSSYELLDRRVALVTEDHDVSVPRRWLQAAQGGDSIWSWAERRLQALNRV